MECGGAIEGGERRRVKKAPELKQENSGALLVKSGSPHLSPLLGPVGGQKNCLSSPTHGEQEHEMIIEAYTGNNVHI